MNDTLLGCLEDGLWHSLDELKKKADESVFSFAEQSTHLVSDESQFLSDGFRLRWMTPQRLLDPELWSVPAELLLQLNQLVGSTSDSVRELDQSSDMALFAAETQLGGRGRRGQPWLSPVGRNLYFSVRFRVSANTSFPNGLSLAVGVALVSALRQAGFSGVMVKWPNDLYLDDKKLGGVLVELRSHASGGFDVVVGVGLNINMHDICMTVDQPWISLAHIYGVQDRNSIMKHVLMHLLPALKAFNPSSFKQTIIDWSGFDLLKGRKVEAQLREGGSVTGLGAGVDESGRFVLDTDSGFVVIDSADASLRLA